MKAGEIVRNRRLILGFTQQMLAQKSGISIGTLQNIEAGIANPSIAILDKILGPLHLETQVVETRFNWDILCELGLPISSNKKIKGVNLTAEILIDNIKIGCLNLSSNPDNRLKIAMESLILAIKQHYPTMFKKKLEKITLIYENFVPIKITGSHIKLRRLALAKIGQYL